jgi:hypothetical protein
MEQLFSFLGVIFVICFAIVAFRIITVVLGLYIIIKPQKMMSYVLSSHRINYVLKIVSIFPHAARLSILLEINAELIVYE